MIKSDVEIHAEDYLQAFTMWYVENDLNPEGDSKATADLKRWLSQSTQLIPKLLTEIYELKELLNPTR